MSGMSGMAPDTAAIGAGTRLRAVLDQVAPALAAASARLWGPDLTVSRYRAWLVTAHQLVRATVPLLRSAERACRRLAPGDPTAAALLPYLAEQVREESGHDAWLRSDHAAAGGDPAALRDAVPSPAVARLAGAPGYWIEHAHPVALLGHIALLEWYPPDPTLAVSLPARLVLPSAAFRTLREHTLLDAAHARRLQQLLDGLELTPRRRHLVLTAALTSAAGTLDILRELTDAPGRNDG